MKALLCTASFALAAAAHAQVVTLTSESWDIDWEAEQISWTMAFDRAPDFWSFDHVGRQADAFTIDLWNNATADEPRTGHEARRVFSNWTWDAGVPERFSLTTSRQSGSAVLDTLGFMLDDSTVRFQTSFDQLSWDGESGLYAVLDTYRYGAWSGQSRVLTTVPAPGALAVGLLAIGASGRPRRPASFASGRRM